MYPRVSPVSPAQSTGIQVQEIQSGQVDTQALRHRGHCQLSIKPVQLSSYQWHFNELKLLAGRNAIIKLTTFIIMKGVTVLIQKCYVLKERLFTDEMSAGINEITTITPAEYVEILNERGILV